MLQRFKEVLSPLKWLILFSAVINVLMLAVPIYSLQLFTRVLTNFSIETLIALSIIVLFLLVIQSILDYLRHQGLLRMGLNLNAAFSGKAITESLLNSCRSRQQDVVFQQDVFFLSRTLSGGNLYHLFDMPFTPLFVAALFIIHPLIGGVTVFVAVILLVLAFVLTKIYASKTSESHHAKLQYHQQSAEAIVSMNMLGGIERNWQKDNNAHLLQDIKHQTNVGKVLTLSKSVRLLLQVGVMGLAVYLAILGEVVPGAVIAVSIIVSRALAPIEQSVTQWSQWAEAWQAYHRIREKLEQAPNEEHLSPVVTEGSLFVEQLYYAPTDPSKPLLKNISLELKQGVSYVVAGNSGAGKSTLLKMLLGLYQPTSGHVLLNGMEVFAWLNKGLAQHFGYLPQNIQPVLGTIAENISRFTEYNENELYAVAKRCGVHKLIMQLPEAYETIIGPGITPFSQGQTQLLGLARAIFGKPYLVVLDEPDSALDQQGENILRAVIAELKVQGTTVVLVTHKRSLLNEFDELIVLDAGRVVDQKKIQVTASTELEKSGSRSVNNKKMSESSTEKETLKQAIKRTRQTREKTKTEELNND